jgi:hypothetical protein
MTTSIELAGVSIVKMFPSVQCRLKHMIWRIQVPRHKRELVVHMMGTDIMLMNLR